MGFGKENCVFLRHLVLKKMDRGIYQDIRKYQGYYLFFLRLLFCIGKLKPFNKKTDWENPDYPNSDLCQRIVLSVTNLF